MIRRAAGLDNRALLPRDTPVVWAPGDFGQARMASLGWLVAVAERKARRRKTSWSQRFRKAGEKSPADLRAIWDWYYLVPAALRQRGGILAAGKLLSRAAPDDPLALWAYLYSLGGREVDGPATTTSSSIRARSQGHHPAARAGRARPCACRASARCRPAGPSWPRRRSCKSYSRSSSGPSGPRRKSSLYRESIAGATQIGQLAGVFGLAAEKGDVDGLLSLCDRYERLQSGRGQQYYYTGSFYFQGPAPLDRRSA